MKILLWPTHYLPYIGGLEVFVHSLAMSLQKRGHEVLVLANAEKWATFSHEGIQVYTFPFITTLYHFDLREIKKILQRVQEIFEFFIPDIVNVHGWFESFCFYQTRILCKRAIPFCITIHGLLEQKTYQTQACIQLWSKARAINTVSKGLIDALKEQGCFHRALQVIYNGLSISSEPLVSLPFKAPQLLMIGRLTEEKCFDCAFQAIKILSQTLPDIKLRLVGGGILYQDLCNLKQELELEPWIEMTDFVPPHQVQHFIDQASLVLIPSYYESFSLVALQAAMRARPVIASNVLGLKEVVIPNETGLLIEPKNPSLLAKTLYELLSTPQKMVQMGENAYQRAKELFSIEKTTDNYLNMYRGIL